MSSGTGFHQLPRFPTVEAYLSSDPVRLPFESGSFDAVLSLGVLEHVAHPHASLEELKRTLAPNGALYVYKLPNRYSYLEKIAKLIGLYYHGANPEDAVYTKRSAVALLTSHGSMREFRQANILPSRSMASSRRGQRERFGRSTACWRGFPDSTSSLRTWSSWGPLLTIKLVHWCRRRLNGVQATRARAG